MMNADLARELWEYRDGALYWRTSPGRRIRIGDLAGNLDKVTGRYRICYDKKLYWRSDLVFLIHKGEWPKHSHCDHKNGDITDDRIENLIDANFSKAHRKNSELPEGIRRTRNNSYVVDLYLGSFKDPLLAAMVYQTAVERVKDLRQLYKRGA